MSDRLVLTYVFDAHCGWCYGFGPAFAALVDQVGDSAEVHVINGGLFIDERSKPIAENGHIPRANGRIADLTGVEFGDGYRQVLAGGTAVLDSQRAAAGFVALLWAAPDQEAALPFAIQRAWYRDGPDLSDPATYAHIAAELGLDGAAVAAAAASPEASAAARAESDRARALGVDEYPTLLITVGGTTRRLGGPVTKPAKLVGLCDEVVASAAGE